MSDDDPFAGLSGFNPEPQSSPTQPPPTQPPPVVETQSLPADDSPARSRAASNASSSPVSPLARSVSGSIAARSRSASFASSSPQQQSPQNSDQQARMAELEQRNQQLQQQNAALLVQSSQSSSEQDFRGQVAHLEAQLKKQKAQFASDAAKFQQQKQAALQRLTKQFRMLTERQKEVYLQSQQRLRDAIKRGKQFETECRQLKANLATATQVKQSDNAKIALLEAQLAENGHDKTTRLQRASSLYDLEIDLSAANARLESIERIDKAQSDIELHIVCVGTPTNASQCSAKTNMRGATSFQWFRALFDQFTPIAGASKATYVLTADDVGCMIKCEVHSLETGMDGVSAEARLGPVRLKPTQLTLLQGYLVRQQIDFKVAPFPVRAEIKSIVLNKEKIKLRNGKNKTENKDSWNDRLRVMLDPDDSQKFAVRVNNVSAASHYMAENGDQRDLIALAVRLFNKSHTVDCHIDKAHPFPNSYMSHLVRECNEAQHSQNSDQIDADEAQAAFSPSHVRRPSLTPSESSIATSVATSVAASSIVVPPSVIQSPIKKSVSNIAAESSSSSVLGVEAKSTKDKPNGVVRYDSEGFIIRKEQDSGPGLFDQPNSKDDDWSDDEDEPVVERSAVLKPLEFKDPSSVQLASDDLLRSSMTGFAKPPPSRSRRGTLASRKDKKDKKRKSHHKKRRSSKLSVPSPGSAESAQSDQSTMSAISENASKTASEVSASSTSVATIQQQQQQHAQSLQMSCTVLETVSCRIQSNKTLEASLVGECLMYLSGAPAAPVKFEVCLAHDQAALQITPNKEIVSELEGAAGRYVVNIPAGDFSKFTLFKYALEGVDTPLPLSVNARWDCDEQLASLNCQCTPNTEALGSDSSLTDVSLLTGLGPAGAVTALTSMSPESGQWSAEHQKLLWKLASLSVNDETELAACFATSQCAQPSDLLIHFKASNNVSGLRMTVDDCGSVQVHSLNFKLRSGDYRCCF